MALIHCPECASDISDKAPQCPTCGYPIRSVLSSESEESVIYEIHPSRVPVLLMMGVVVAYFLLICIPLQRIAGMVGLAWLLLFLLLAATAVLDLRRVCTLYTLTTQRIRVKAGILSRVERTIPITKIQNVTAGYTMLQRILGIGDVIIESAAERSGWVWFAGVDSPLAYANRILEVVRGTNHPQPTGRA